jgi:hypothetical protein
MELSRDELLMKLGSAKSKVLDDVRRSRSKKISWQIRYL